MPEMSGVGEISVCWNSIYQLLSRTKSKYEELKAQNPNITIIVEEVSARVKERFLELIELLLLENRDLNRQPDVDKRRMSAVEWQYGPRTEYFLKNDVLGTIVSFAAGHDMPRDLVDEIAYLIASLAHDLPPSFLVNESILRPTAQFLEVLIAKPSKYSVVLCEKIVNRISEYPPLWKLFAAEYDNSLARLIIVLFPIPEAFVHMSSIFKTLCKLEGVEAELLGNVLNMVVETLGKGFETTVKAEWTQAAILTFLETARTCDSFIISLSDEGKCRAAQEVKNTFVKEHLKPSLRLLKLHDGSVVRSLDFLSSFLSHINSVELCLPVAQCFKNYFFTELADDTDCINLPRLLFAEGEMNLSLAVIDMLNSLLDNRSRKLLAVFQKAQSPIKTTNVISAEDHRQMCGQLLALIESLPEAIIDKNIENMSLLYRSHLIHAESFVPQDKADLNVVEEDPSIFTSLLVKILDSYAQDFWARSPKDNLRVCRLLFTLVGKCDVPFVYDRLFGKDAIYSLSLIGQKLIERANTEPLTGHLNRIETTRSIARFRASLFDQVHSGSVEEVDMFAEGGLLDQLLSGMEPKTVGALSGNVLLFSCFYLRLLAIIQVQSTRPYKTLSYC